MISKIQQSFDRNLISIIMPTFQHGHCINKSIKSVISQTHKDWELLIVDNYSVDNTEKVVNGFDDPRIIYFKYSNNGIIAASRNYGISQASGSWVAFLDSDDWWAPTKLERSIFEGLKSDSDIIYHDLFLVKSNSQKLFISKAKGRKMKGKIYENLLNYGNALLNSSVVVKKEVIIKVGCISEEKDKVSWEDFDYWLRISKITNKFLYINEPLGYYWIGGGNISSPDNVIRNTTSIAKYYENFFNTNSGKPFWFSNGRGKAFLETRMYNESIYEFQSIDKSSIKFINLIKVKLRILQIYIMKIIEKLNS